MSFQFLLCCILFITLCRYQVPGTRVWWYWVDPSHLRNNTCFYQPKSVFEIWVNHLFTLSYWCDYLPFCYLQFHLFLHFKPPWSSSRPSLRSSSRLPSSLVMPLSPNWNKHNSSKFRPLFILILQKRCCRRIWKQEYPKKVKLFWNVFGTWWCVVSRFFCFVLCLLLWLCWVDASVLLRHFKFQVLHQFLLE